METVEIYDQQRKTNSQEIQELINILHEGSQFGVQFDEKLEQKLQEQIENIQNKKLKVVLVGGFSEGKTSIAAAWLDKLEGSMKISQSESSDEVATYNEGSVELVDTPGLFGFKKTIDEQKYRDITKKYISEANIILFVMNSTNPIKESNKELMQWLFSDLNFLKRTIFVLSRFDDVADVEDNEEYNEVFSIKKDNVIERLRNFNIINSDDIVPVVAVSANPFGEGIKYWLTHTEEYRKLSHIEDLQKATTRIVATNGGEQALVVDTQRSVIQDILLNKVPEAEKKLRQSEVESQNFVTILESMQQDLSNMSQKMNRTQVDLQRFVVDYFTDIIVRLGGTDLDTFNDFFEQNIGENAYNIQNSIEIKFKEEIGNLSAGIDRIQISLKLETDNYNNVMHGMAFTSAKVGKEVLAKMGPIGPNAIKGVRNVLLPTFKFKPWGAVKIANGFNNGIPLVGSALDLTFEIWDTFSKAQKEKKFKEGKKECKEQLEEMRQEYGELVHNTEKFKHNFFKGYEDLENAVVDMEAQANKSTNMKTAFEQWRKRLEVFEDNFEKIY